MREDISYYFRRVLRWSLSFKLVLLMSSELYTVEIFEACLVFTSWCQAPSAIWWQVVSAAVCDGLVDCRWHGRVWRKSHVSCERSYWIIQNRFHHLRLLLSSSSCPFIMFMSAWFDHSKIVLCWYLNSTNHQEIRPKTDMKGFDTLKNSCRFGDRKAFLRWENAFFDSFEGHLWVYGSHVI